MSAVVSGSWPDVVWDAPMLRGLDARARGEIEAAGRLRRLRAGEVLYKHGDPADALFVVAAGSLELRGVRRGDAGVGVIRRAERGDVLGEEATVAAFTTRQLEATCQSADATLAEVPLVVLKRAIGRSGGAELMAKVERVLRRAATLDLLRTTSFTSKLPDAERELLLDAARHMHVDRGEYVYREGDVATDAFLVADGLLQAQMEDDGRPRVEAYLGRGDLFGDEELKEREPRACSVVANGPTWLVAIPRDVFVVVARRNADALTAARRLRSDSAAAEKRVRPGANTTAHVFRDLYRMRVARSLLVIDQDACIRCGHCAWSCADAHADGVSRLVRRGDKIVVSDGGAESTTRVAPLLVPNSCQHCKNPSCMIDCPTGAIGRDARGEVFIREDLCTGCGSCAKACPWENIQMAPRRDALAFPAVAVKCDLCKGVDGGPACVASCPTQAIARIDPNAALVELRLPRKSEPAAGAPPVMPPKLPSWPWALGGAFSGVGIAFSSLGVWTTGISAGALVGLLLFYSALKRARGPLAKLRGKVPLSRWMYIAHVSLGTFLVGVLVAHTGLRVPSNAAGALTLAIALTIATGLVGAFLVKVIPPALSRIERKSVLPEELYLRPKEIDERIFQALSGKSELTKTLYVKTLRPYVRSTFGPLSLLATRRSLREEERALRARLDASMAGEKRGDANASTGINDLVRLVVERRAVKAQRLLTWLLRGFVVPHLAVTTAAIVLLFLHIFAVTRPLGPRPAKSPATASSSGGLRR